jgi:YD repeat-containing protein
LEYARGYQPLDDIYSSRHGPFWSGGLGSYVTPGTVLGDTSASLVPNSLRGTSTAWNGLTRPTLQGAVDLVTGKPLLSVTDLEIPFGNAVFRLVRTKTDDAREYMGPGKLSGTAGWDWAGGGWMMSENPVLLVDSAYAPVVGNEPRTCFLVLDAHHSIPFQFIESNGLYEAPARFQAKLTHNGVWGPNGWSSRPTRFVASVYNGQLHYTFEVIYEDMPKHYMSPGSRFFIDLFSSAGFPRTPTTNPNHPFRFASDMHRRPILLQQLPEAISGHDPFNSYHNPGFGIPYQALCVRIHDNYGHAADIEYCKVTQFNADFSKSPWSDVADANGFTNISNTPCVECVQGCTAKGQISSITLSVNGEAKWKLLYSFRATLGNKGYWNDRHDGPITGTLFDDYSQFWPSGESWFADVSGPRVLDQVYVFPVTTATSPALASSPTCNVFPAMHVFGSTSDSGGLSAAALRRRPSSLPIDTFAASTPWKYRVRYFHSLVKNDRTIGSQTDLIADRTAKPLLVNMVTRTSAAMGTELIETDQVRERLYVYEEPQLPSSVSSHTNTNIMAVFEHDDLQEFLRSARLAHPWITADHLALQSNADFYPLQSLSSADFVSNSTVGFQYDGAAISMDDVTTRTAVGPSWNDLKLGTGIFDPNIVYSQLNGASTPGLGGCASLASIKLPDGTRRIYRLFRLAVDPSRVPDTYTIRDNLARAGVTNHPSAHHPPFRWHAYFTTRSTRETDGFPLSTTIIPPDLSAPRWITIVDEFSSWREMVDTNKNYGGSGSDSPHNTHGTKPGQTSRRSVEVNASGVLLRDRLWEFNFANGSVQLVTEGLGEEFVYERAVNVIERNSNQWVPNPPGTDAPDDNNPFDAVAKTDHFASIRSELLLVERRSVGWSVTQQPTASPGSDTHEGLVAFYHYKPVAYSYDATPNDTTDDKFVEVLQPVLIAEGVRQGRYYNSTRLPPESHDDRSAWLAFGHYDVNDNNDATSIITKAYFKTQLDGINVPSPAALTLCGPSPEMSSSTGNWVRDVEVAFTTPIRETDFFTLVGWNNDNLACALNAPPVNMDASGTWSAQSYTATHWLRNYSASSNPEINPLQRAVEQTLVVGPPRKLRPDQQPGEGWFYPVQRDWIDSNGRKTWSAEGLLRDPLASTPVPDDEHLQTWNYTRYFFDSFGRPEHIVVDPDLDGASPAVAHSGAPLIPTGGSVWDLPSDGLDRLPTPSANGRWTPPLKYVTSFMYEGDRTTDIFYPNGRRWMSRLVSISKKENCWQNDAENPEDDQCASDGTLWWNQSAVPTGVPGASPIGPYEHDQLVSLPPEQMFTREYVFNEVERRTRQGPSDPYPITELVSRVVGEVRDYPARSPLSNPIQVRRVYFAKDAGTRFGPQALPLPLDSSGNVAFDEEGQPRFVIEAAVAGNASPLALDANGRVTSATLLEPDPDGRMFAVGSKEVNELIDMRREREIDKTITRTTMNTIGQPMRQYVGTIDTSWSGTTNGSSNLVIVNRNAYGSGVTDARLPKVAWKYRSHPTWADEPFNNPSTDTAGAKTVTTYDWRMRPVQVDEFDYPDSGTAVRLRTTLTYFDNLDRVIATVTFGADSASGTLNLSDVDVMDPSVGSDSWFDVNDSGLVRVVSGSSPISWTSLFEIPGFAPTSATLNYYGPDGTVSERREYDVSAYVDDPLDPGTYPAPGAMQYQAFYSYRGGGGQVVYSQRPGAPVAISTTDGVGRVVRTDMRSRSSGPSSSWPTYSATESIYDADGNAVDVRSLERLADASGLIATLTDQVGQNNPNAVVNAVRQRTVSWFDPSKRVDATLVLGSEQLAGHTPGPTSFVRSMNDGNQSRPWLEVQGGQLIRHVSQSIKNSGGLLTINHHNIATGRITHVRNPDDTITETLYDPAGRVKTVTENWEGAGEKQRRTDYEYRYGRLAKILTGTGAAPATSLTEVRYGADVLEYYLEGDQPTYRIKSTNNGLIGMMHREAIGTDEHPDPSKMYLTFAYTFNGLLARRTDARGVTFQYFYDGLDRLTEIQVGRMSGLEFKFMDLPENMQVNGALPSSLVHRVTISYNPRGLVERVTAYGPGGSEIVSESAYVYDGRGLLRREIQAHGEGVADPLLSMSPSMVYNWEYKHTDEASTGHTRLNSMVYPSEGMAHTPRAVLFDYGAVNSPNSLMSRVGAIKTRADTLALRTLAGYEYAGTNRRVATTVPVFTSAQTAPHLAALSLFTNSQLGTTTLGGFDRFGRSQLWDVQAPSASSTSVRLAAARYSYDIMGNRIAQDVSQVAYGTADPARSQVHTYDSLNRLIASKVGAVNYGQAGPSISSASLLRNDEWTLDALGNWAGNGVKPGRLTDATTVTQVPLAWGIFNTSSGQAPWIPASTHPMTVGSFDVSHAVNDQSEIDSVLTQVYGTSPSSVTTAFFYDAAGNLVFDGQHFYSYDAWNRLAQINKASLPQPQPPPAELGIEDVIIGDLVRHYTYDGLGRLIRVQFPYRYVRANTVTPPVTMPGLRSERYYYDGIRRIQTITIDDVVSLETAMAMGSSNSVQQLAEAVIQSTAEIDIVDENGVVVSNAELDGETTPMAVEAEFVEQLVARSELNFENPYPTVIRLHREYVWAPGDNGVDELVAYFGDNRQEPFWTIQDAGGDVVAVIDDNGSPRTVATSSGNVSVPTARVVAQWTYDAYGDVLSADYFAAHATCDIGHKGLFVDRLDMQQALQAGNYTTDTPPKLVPYSQAIYHNRNRTYAPGLGRFMQSDPNATGMVTADDVSQFHGALPWHVAMSVNLRAHLRDSASAYTYLRANPWSHADPLGLWTEIGPNDTIYDPKDGEFKPSPWSPNHPQRQPRPQRPTGRGSGNGIIERPSASDFVEMAGSAGRIVGAYWAAAMFGDNLDRRQNGNLGSIFDDASRSLRFDAAHMLVDRFGFRGLPVKTMLYGMNWGLTERDSGWQRASVELGIGVGGDLALPRVSNTVGMYLAPFAFAAGVYGGVIEYAADSMHHW